MAACQADSPREHRQHGSVCRRLACRGVATNDPRVNPLYADLSGLPPIMVYYGAHDLLAGEAIEFGTRAKSFGLDVSLHSLPEGQHNFIFGAGRVPEVDQAIGEMARWLRFKLGLSAMHS